MPLTPSNGMCKAGEWRNRILSIDRNGGPVARCTSRPPSSLVIQVSLISMHALCGFGTKHAANGIGVQSHDEAIDRDGDARDLRLHGGCWIMAQRKAVVRPNRSAPFNASSAPMRSNRVGNVSPALIWMCSASVAVIRVESEPADVASDFAQDDPINHAATDEHLAGVGVE